MNGTRKGKPGNGSIAPPGAASSEKRLYGALAAGGVASVALVSLPDYLPMVDLPQHAAQVSTWMRLDDPQSAISEQFELNLRTPYLVAYAVARLFGFWGSLFGLKVVVALSVVGLPISMLVLLRRTGREPSWALLGFPLAFNFSFYWGLVSFILALPLYLLAIVVALNHADREDFRSSLALAGLTTGMFFVHGLAFYMTLGTCGLVSLLSPGPLRRRVRRLAPYVLPVALGVFWAVAFLDQGAHPDANVTRWRPGLWRLRNLPGELLGGGSVDGLATLGGLAVLALLWVGRPRWSREARLYGPLVLVAVCYLIFPLEVRGVALVPPRFAVLVVPALLLVLEGRSEAKGRARRALALGFSVAWLTVLAVRFHGFHEESRGFDTLVGEMAPDRGVFPVILDHGSSWIPGPPVFVHFPAYYQAQKGGVSAVSFARFRTAVVRYKAGVDQEVINVWDPEDALRGAQVGSYDYLVMRAASGIPDGVKGSLEAVGRLVHRGGAWYLFEIASPGELDGAPS